jgi:hypothetical protein
VLNEETDILQANDIAPPPQTGFPPQEVATISQPAVKDEDDAEPSYTQEDLERLERLEVSFPRHVLQGLAQRCLFPRPKYGRFVPRLPNQVKGSSVNQYLTRASSRRERSLTLPNQSLYRRTSPVLYIFYFTHVKFLIMFSLCHAHLVNKLLFMGIILSVSRTMYFQSTTQTFTLDPTSPTLFLFHIYGECRHDLKYQAMERSFRPCFVLDLEDVQTQLAW